MSLNSDELNAEIGRIQQQRHQVSLQRAAALSDRTSLEEQIAQYDRVLQQLAGEENAIQKLLQRAQQADAVHDQEDAALRQEVIDLRVQLEELQARMASQPAPSPGAAVGENGAAGMPAAPDAAPAGAPAAL